MSRPPATDIHRREKSRPRATDTKAETTDSKAEIFDMPTAVAAPRPSCGDIDGDKLHEQDTDGQAGRLADKWGLLFCLFLLIDVFGARAVASA